jgi:hypothetical protein
MSQTLAQEAILRRRPIGYWLAWLVLAGTLIPANPTWGGGPMHWSLQREWGSLASFFLLCAAAIRLVGAGPETDVRRGHPVARLVRAAWWSTLLATWVIFWASDLHRAQFRITLLSIPAVALVALAGGLISRGRRFLSQRASWSAAVAIGIAIGLGLVCALMAPRCDDGCSGVSTAYRRTQFITLIALYLLGPAMLAPSFSACFARPWWRRAANVNTGSRPP